MSLRPLSRVWQGDRRLECVVYVDDDRGRWQVRLKRGAHVLHHIEVDDPATAYSTALRWRRDAEYLAN
jgi:hypothetical protein